MYFKKAENTNPSSTSLKELLEIMLEIYLELEHITEYSRILCLHKNIIKTRKMSKPSIINTILRMESIADEISHLVHYGKNVSLSTLFSNLNDCRSRGAQCIVLLLKILKVKV